jgi:hypothetical protein
MKYDHLMILQGKNVVCQKHLEGITTDREAGQFFNLMLKETMTDPLFKGFCGRDEEKGVPASLDKIPDVLLSVLPLCCFLGDKRLEGIKQQIKILPRQKLKANVEDQIFTPVEFNKLLGWKQANTFTDKSQAVSYAKGFSDARRKVEVVILDLSDRFEVWTRKIEEGSAPSK